MSARRLAGADVLALVVAFARAAAAPASRDGSALQLQQAERVGWTYVNNHNLPEGRGVASMCAGDFGIMVFGGEITEYDDVAETLLLDRPGGTWRTLEYDVHPSARALGATARYRGGCLLYGGVGPGTQGYPVHNDTWFWTLEGGWVELTATLDRAPRPVFYHTLCTMSNGELFMFGGRNELNGNAVSSTDDAWIYNEKGWTQLRWPHLPEGINQPSARWGHGMTCALSNTGPASVRGDHLPPGNIECVLFGGAQVGDDDFFDDTWLLRYETNETADGGTPLTPRRYYWEQLNAQVRPHGRWCFQMATCGSRVVMTGGSVDYRVAADETWVWQPTIRSVESSAASGHTGEWVRLYGTDAFYDEEPRRPGAGPRRISAMAMTNVGVLAQSDIILFGGVNNAVGGNFLHKGWETSEMWRWPCNEEEWPEALIASPPMPPSPPPPPSLPPGEYNGGVRGYFPHLRRPPAPERQPGLSASSETSPSGAAAATTGAAAPRRHSINEEILAVARRIRANAVSQPVA